MTSRRRLRHRYDPPPAEPESLTVKPVSPFPAAPDTEPEAAPPPAGANGQTTFTYYAIPNASYTT